MHIKKELIKSVYGVALKTARKSRDMYFKQRVYSFNRSLAKDTGAVFDQNGIYSLHPAANLHPTSLLYRT